LVAGRRESRESIDVGSPSSCIQQSVLLSEPAVMPPDDFLLLALLLLIVLPLSPVHVTRLDHMAVPVVRAPHTPSLGLSGEANENAEVGSVLQLLAAGVLGQVEEADDAEGSKILRCRSSPLHLLVGSGVAVE
jgi:hypothetical protein